MAAKYRQYFDEMMEINSDLFAQFQKLHDAYAQDPKKWQQEFNEEGEKVLSIIRRTENNLCGKSENSGYGKFSTNLSDKFWREVHKQFPKIDFIGIQ